MAAALALFVKLIPLYLTVALGWVAGRYLEASGRQLAGIMLYIVTPSVVFSGVMAAPLSPEVVLLPFLTFGLSCVLGISQLKLARKVVTDGSANIIPLCVGSGNTGYFGVPVALLLFGEEGLGLYIVCMLGTTLFENSVGFYLAARGRYDLRGCAVAGAEAALGVRFSGGGGSEPVRLSHPRCLRAPVRQPARGVQRAWHDDHRHEHHQLPRAGG